MSSADEARAQAALLREQAAALEASIPKDVEMEQAQASGSHAVRLLLLERRVTKLEGGS